MSAHGHSNFLHLACSIELGTPLAEVIKAATLILWDEATVAHRHAFEPVDRTLQDITKVPLPFGGKVVAETSVRSYQLCAVRRHRRLWQPAFAGVSCAPHLRASSTTLP